MKLYPKAKPVKIRMEYLGKEHYSLDSILKEFDLFEINKLLENSQFIKWLLQQNESRLIESLQPIIEGIKNGEKPELQDLLMAFYPEYFNGNKKTFKELYYHFQSFPQLQNLASVILKNEFDKDYKSVEVNEILRDFKEHQLKSQGYVEYELLKTNYELAKEGHNDAKKFILDKFKWIKNFDSLEILFFRRTPESSDIEDLPLIFSFWKENGFNETFNNYVNTHSEFLSSHEKISEFLPNVKYHKRFKHLNKEELNYLTKAISLSKEGKRFPCRPKDIPEIFSYLQVIENLRTHILNFKNSYTTNFYNENKNIESNIYERKILKIGKSYLIKYPGYSDVMGLKKREALKSMEAVLDAYFYSEIEFKKLHPDLPYL